MDRAKERPRAGETFRSDCSQFCGVIDARFDAERCRQAVRSMFCSQLTGRDAERCRSDSHEPMSRPDEAIASQ